MRRAIAFTIDTFLCSLVVTAVLELISKLSNRDLVNAYSILLGVALIFSVFEHFYGGYTPGKFVCRIRLVTADGKVPSLFRLFFVSCSWHLVAGRKLYTTSSVKQRLSLHLNRGQTNSCLSDPLF